MPPPPTRREQLQLDELLSDIYRGIEALPDKSAYSYTSSNNNHNTATSHSGTYGSAAYQFNSGNKSSEPTRKLVARTHLKEYELPESSPLVKQHLAALREDSSQQQQQLNSSLTNKQPQRSTLKRSTNTPDIYSSRNAPQSLASFVTSTPTPENKRRVRIVDHPESRKTNSNSFRGGDDTDDYADYALDEQNERRRPGEKVKYVNTNKLIYHQERNPDDYGDGDVHKSVGESDDDDDLDGKTRVEYYHTTWLDRQLGRASKRRSSKELNERQVKEKAMIEELKRSLKSGAITLRQSLRGKKNNNKHNNSTDKTFNDSTDDYRTFNTTDDSTRFYSHATSSSLKHSHNPHHKHYNHKSNAIYSGQATLPRNYGKTYLQATPVCYDTWASQQRSRSSTSPKKSPVDHHHHHHHHHNKVQHTSGSFTIEPDVIDNNIEEPSNSYWSQQSSSSQQQQQQTTPKQTSSGNNFLLSNKNYSNTLSNSNRMQPQNNDQSTRQTASQLYSRTLPHKRGQHSLIESHLRGGGRNLTLEREQPAAVSSTLPYSQQPQQQARGTPAPATSSDMHNQSYVSSPAAGMRSPSQAGSCAADHQQYRQRPAPNDTISSMPSATEVVRSALSRSSSQVSLNLINKTINLLPNSPPPYSPSPLGQTSSQQLKASSPSLSPSPAGARCNTLSTQHRPIGSNSASATTPSDRVQRLHGTRTLDRPRPDQEAAAPNSRQPIYANPHASLMQHRAEQQARQPARNTASIREFNELDNLLRSLSPASTAYSAPASQPHQQQRQQSCATTQITPGFSSKPSQPSIGGYGFSAPAASGASNKPLATNNRDNELYARVHKPTGPTSTIYQTPAAAGGNQTKASYLHQNYALAAQQQQQQPFTIDVTNKKSDENCLKRQDLSEFEAPIELLPSMEDYQNITKLNPVKNHYWYKPNMSRDRAISLLKDKPQGTFIVRDSTSFRGAYGLALKVAKLPKNVLNNANLRNFNANDPAAELIRHFLIEPTPSGVRLKGYENEPIFNSLPDLIYQHSLTELALPCKLIIPRADIEDPNFNLKQKQFFDDFVASKELAKHLPYERTSPDGGYRKYPGDVYVHNEHRIIFE